MNPLPVQRAGELPAVPQEHRWLVEGLWAELACGIVGGEPKCCKTFLALDLAVAVASGTSCLRTFPVPRPGRVLVFAAEDPLFAVRERLAGIAAASGVALADLDVHLITVPTLRLDLAADRQRLADTVDALAPRLLVLDPFVRLHRVDENASGEIAPILAWLRELQRAKALAVAVVHHAKKGGANLRAGQALRGSSEFHAWGDSNLYLARRGEALTLSIEHRAAPGRLGLKVALRAGPGLALALTGEADPPDREPPGVCVDQRVIDALASAAGPLSPAALRERLALRNKTVADAVARLVTAGRVVRDAGGLCSVAST